MTINANSYRKRVCTLAASAVFLAQALATTALAQGSTTLQNVDKAWSLSFDMETRFIAWNGNIGFPNANQLLPGTAASGSQVYTPVSFGLTYAANEAWKLELTARSGFVSGSQDAPTAALPQQIGSFGSLTDTTLGFRATYTGIDGFVPFWALNMNLPTGRSVLTGPARFARLDPDVVDMPSFGQGFNIGQVFGANIPLSPNQLLTISVGHTLNLAHLRDNYDFTNLVDVIETFKPSDSYTANLGYSIQIDQTNVTLGAFVLFNTESYVNGVKFFQAGTTFGLNAGLSHQWADWTATAVNLGWTHSDRNLNQDGLGGLLVEPQNSNSASYTVALNQTFNMDRWTFGLGTNFLYRDRNSYDPVNVSFTSAKTKWGLEGSVGYKLNNKSRLTAKLERFWVNNDPTQPRTVPFALGATPLFTTDGWKVTFGGAIEF